MQELIAHALARISKLQRLKIHFDWPLPCLGRNFWGQLLFSTKDENIYDLKIREAAQMLARLLSSSFYSLSIYAARARGPTWMIFHITGDGEAHYREEKILDNQAL